tara:strand:- start:299 stop:427 length:129 start_codon:yes stop_codon:yes gene_type:complete
MTVFAEFSSLLPDMQLCAFLILQYLRISFVWRCHQSFIYMSD